MIGGLMESMMRRVTANRTRFMVIASVTQAAAIESRAKPLPTMIGDVDAFHRNAVAFCPPYLGPARRGAVGLARPCSPGHRAGVDDISPGFRASRSHSAAVHEGDRHRGSCRCPGYRL